MQKVFRAIVPNRKYRNVSKHCYVGVDPAVGAPGETRLGLSAQTLGGLPFWSIPGAIWHDDHGLISKISGIAVRCTDEKELAELVAKKPEIKVWERGDVKGFYDPTYILEDVTDKYDQMAAEHVDLFGAGEHIADLKAKAAESDAHKKKAELLEKEHAAMRKELDALKSHKSTESAAAAADAAFRKK